jgi:DNA-binding NtrC family response regulator/tetratricopeptide (TPR) repeat protein
MADPRPLHPVHPTDRIIGYAPAIATLRAHIRRLAAFDAVGNPLVPTVLLQGETGTGKGLVARVLHDSGPRAQGPFLEVNCAAIPEALLEAELFGFEAGAFTDAKHAKPGLFEAASGGTLFLDEIDALPLVLQGKLLTAIEAKRVRRVGAVRETAVDVKLIVATPVALSAQVTAGRFRADLYHRLAVVLLDLPPLRERGEDILLLAHQGLRQYAEAYRLGPKRLSGAAEAWLQRYDWPGNVRELSHLMEQVTLLSTEALVDSQTLERLCLPRPPSSSGTEVGLATEARQPLDEAARIRQALRQPEGNVVQAARLLGLSRKALRYRMRRYGIARPAGEARPSALALVPFPLADRPGEGVSGHQADSTAPPLSLQAMIPALDWEQKPVAVLAIEVTWPETAALAGPHYEPFTVNRRWEQAIAEKVQGFGGVILQHSPSLLLVAIGIPHTVEQLPQRAVQAALAVRQLLVQDTRPDQEEPGPTVRLAVHLGQVLLGSGAHEPIAHLLPVGEALALPVRLLGQAAPGEIVVSAPVGRLIEGWFALESRAGPSGDGSPDPSGASVVLGLRPQPSPLRLQGRRPLTPFVGRARELAVLEDLLGQAQEGRGQVVGMIGEPGAGKSRLCDEFIRAPRLPGWQILATSATAYGQATPYLPVIDLLKAYFEIVEQDAVPTLRAKITAKLQTLDAAFEPSLPAFLSLLDVPVEEPAWQALDPPHRRLHTLDALKRLLLWESQVQPLLLVVENLHWIDGETQALLDTLIDSLPAARLLLLVTYRPEYEHRWGSKTSYTQLRLDPLSAPHAQALLGALLGADPSLTPFIPRVIAQTEGNPFFLEESVRTLVETHVLAGAPGAYRLAQAVEHIQVPATVHMVLAARIDRLSAGAKHLLQTAAVIGKDVPLALLLAVAEGPEAVVHQRLAALQAAEFLYEARFAPERVYTFKHALTHEVAYGSLLPERRRALHARIVSALEALVGERLTEHIERLAHHALQGEVWNKVLAYCRQAGEKAMARSAYREAVGYFEQALGALPHLPETRDTRAQAIDLRLALRSALVPSGDLERTRGLVHEAEALAEALDDPRRLGQVSIRLSLHFRSMGAYDQAIAAAQRALALATADGDVILHALANRFLGHAYLYQGDYRRAIDCFGQAVASLEGAERRDPGLVFLPAVLSRAHLAWCHAELGTFAEGRALGEEGLRIAEAVDHPANLMLAYKGIGLLALRQGDLPRALRLLERALGICQEAGLPMHFGVNAVALGEAYTLGGRVADGVSLLTRALEQTMAMARVDRQARYHFSLGEAQLLAGRLDAAQALAEGALALAREYQERGHQAYALRLLGEIAAHREPPEVEQAGEHYRQALALAEALGMRPLQAHCHLGLGTLSAKIGQQEIACTELSAAIDLYRAMEMTFWLPQAEATLAEVEGR